MEKGDETAVDAITTGCCCVAEGDGKLLPEEGVLAVVLLKLEETESKGVIVEVAVVVVAVLTTVVVVVVVVAVVIAVILPVVAGFVEDVEFVELESLVVDLDSELVHSLKLSNCVGLNSLLGLRPVTIRLQ